MDVSLLIQICMLPVLGLSATSGVHTGSSCNERCHRCNDDQFNCEECIYGWYGHDCNRKCRNCWVSGCNDTGRCNQCQPGRYREDCRSDCPQNCRRDNNGDKFCRREDGKCLDGCSRGWWGETCNLKCNHQCDDLGCIQENGHCIGNCRTGWWGLKCDRKCPLGCKNNKCECLSGKCNDGCVHGFKGEICSVPKHCRNERFLHGNVSHLGQCMYGCKPGWTSASCNEKCPGVCLICHQTTRECEKCPKSSYGKDCTQDCSSNCLEYECNMQGHCTRGCRDGFWGPTCKKVCPFNCLKCSQDGITCDRIVYAEGIAEALTGKATGQIYVCTTIAACALISWILTKGC